MKRLSLLLLSCFLTTFLFANDGIGLSTNYAKKKKKRFKLDKNRIIVGGGLGGGGLQGGYILSVTPSLGYRVTDRFHAGVNFGYFYSRQKLPYLDGSYDLIKNRVISPSLFARFFPIDVVFLQVMPEFNFVKQTFEQFSSFTQQTTEQEFKNNIPAVLVGGGYAQRLGNSSYMMVSVMYDIVQNPNSPYYRQPVFGGGLALGLFGR
jgi:hypothetical protein